MPNARPLHVIVLAAGQGKRMRSELPKVLHTLGGLPLVEHVLRAVDGLSPAAVHVVHGHGGALVKAALSARDGIQWAHQAEQLGTGHAVAQAMINVPRDASVVVCYGDVPLVTRDTLARVAEPASAGQVALLTAELDDPRGYGRIIRAADGAVTRIVEQRDASQAEQAIREINTGILGGPADAMADWVERLDNDTAQGEYYLTDVIAMAAGDGYPVVTATVADRGEVEGVNDRVQLAWLERHYQRHRAEQLMRAGAQLADPARIDIRGDVEVGSDVFIDVDCVFEGDVRLGDRAHVGPFCHLKNSTIANDAMVHSHCSLDGAELGEGAETGPFARLRPGAKLGAGARIGNFVEMKNSVLGDGSKANHLTYLGDASIGRSVNVGAGTITCNYDGANKHRTEIGDNVFVGSGVQLVAPLRINAGATIGAGSTITSDVDPELLVLSRTPQKSIKGWERPKKNRP